MHLLIIRDPDDQTFTVADFTFTEVEIDIGMQWASYKDFCSHLQDDDPDALDYVKGIEEQVAHLEDDNVVKREVMNYFKQARED